MNTPLDIALDYIGPGWNPVPVDHRSKKPSAGSGWQGALTEAREEEMRKIARNEEDLVLEEIGNHPHSSQADIARQLGWLNPKGGIQKAKVHRIVKELKKQKLIEETRAGLTLTDKGKKSAKDKR